LFFITVIFFANTPPKRFIIAGVLSGAVTVIVWNQIEFLKSMMYELVPAFILAFMVTIVVSLFTKKPEGVEEMLGSMREGE